MKISFIFIGILLVIILIIIANLIWEKEYKAMDDYQISECNKLNGTSLIYECYNGAGSDCSKVKTGFWCTLPNGTQIQFRVNLSSKT